MRNGFLTYSVVGTFLLSTLFYACNPDPKPEPEPDPVNPTTGSLKVNFVPTFNGSPLAFYTDFYNPLSQRIQFEMLKFYTTNFYAKKTSGDSVLVTDAFKYDYDAGLSSFTITMNPGDYTGMWFGFGVDTAYNHDDPTLLPATHPLSYTMASGMHWSWSSGYIFMKLEAKADVSGTGTGPLSTFVAFHPGTDACYEPTPFLPKTFSISAGSTTTLNLEVDVAKFLTQPDDTIDLSIDNVTHATDYPMLAKRVAKNAARSFSFQ